MMEDAAVLAAVEGFLAATDQPALQPQQKERLAAAMYCLKGAAKTLPQLLEKARFALAERPLDRDEKAEKALDDVFRGILKELTPQLQNASWDRDTLEGVLNEFAEAHGTKFGKLAAPLRAALAGRAVTPSVFDMMLVLGREETIARLSDAST
jgi:glutamyl-tRNA synthetase